jgi:hypothetical protein
VASRSRGSRTPLPFSRGRADHLEGDFEREGEDTKTIAVAIAVALVTAGSSTAAFVVTSANIKNGTIKLVDISSGAKRALRGQRGPRGLPGQDGPPGIQALVRVSESKQIPGGVTDSVIAHCPAGLNPVSGGFTFASGLGGKVTSSQMAITEHGWAAVAFVDPSSSSGELTAYAYCTLNVNIG